MATERAAVVSQLPATSARRIGRFDAIAVDTGAGEMVCVCGGVGPAAAAAVTATALALDPPYDVVLTLGVGGGFTGRADRGAIVVGDALVAADLGADSPNGPLTLADLGLGETTYPVPRQLTAALADRARTAGCAVVTGPVLTVSTATGTAARATALAARFGGVAEAMEGFGVRTAAAPYGVPVGEVRAISNVVGDRDVAAWDIPGALAALARAVAAIVEEPLRL